MNAVDELKKFEPASLKVVLSDGTEKPVAVPRIRNRWHRVQQVLDSVSWVKIEALDKQGQLLGVVEDEAQVEEVVDEYGARDIAVARLLADVQRSTMREVRSMFEVQLKGLAALIDASVASVQQLTQSYEMSMQVQRAAIATQAAEHAGGNPEMMAMLQLALGGMMQSKPLIKEKKP